MAALPPKATPFLPFSAADPTDLDFLNYKKEIRRGEIQKQSKSRAGGAGLRLSQANGGAGFAGCPLFSTSHLFLSVGFC